MNIFTSISKKIISLKHWQLFILIIMPLAWTADSSYDNFINLIGIIIFSLWIYGIGLLGFKNIFEYDIVNLDIKKFKKNSVAAIIMLIILFLLHIMEQFGYTDNDTQIIIIPVGGYFIYSFLYIIVFSSKVLTILELRRKVTISDYFWNLFLMLNLFIGIWFLQPKINKLIR